jgi:hypothetical protein
MSGPRQVSSLHVPNLLAIPSPTTPRRSGCLACFRNRTYRRPRPIGRTTHWAGFRSTSLGLRHGLASSPRRQAESSSSSYGLVIHLPMLSTSPRGDAVPVDYGGQADPRQGLTPCWFDTLTIARARFLRNRDPVAERPGYRVSGRQATGLGRFSPEKIPTGGTPLGFGRRKVRYGTAREACFRAPGGSSRRRGKDGLPPRDRFSVHRQRGFRPWQWRFE